AFPSSIALAMGSGKLDEISAELDCFFGPFLRDLLRVQMVGPENTRLDKFVALFEQKYRLE
ncbi:hypothetical protein, partial [Citrobacter youngae]|uniref:hypothetical protein n=1 Tax=Citrobacter youngae TaxID=133448 RepID=UPI0019547698